jgi:predicted nucleic acid-binding protein
MAGDRYLVDSNILLRILQPEDPSFPVVTAAVRKLLRERSVPCYTSQNLGEFWNVLTRPARQNGFGLSIEEAHIRAEEIESEFQLLPDSRAAHEEWRRLLVDYRISGVQVHDARLVASMHIHGIKRILTFNTRDFARFTDIDAVHPADLAT